MLLVLEMDEHISRCDPASVGINPPFPVGLGIGREEATYCNFQLLEIRWVSQSSELAQSQIFC